jgi:hypothetical protein
VLLIAAVVAALFALGFAAVLVITLTAMKRLRLQPWAVLEWFGLAESQQSRPQLRPVATPASRRPASAPGT